MAVGKRYTVTFHEDASTGDLILETLNFMGEFTYEAGLGEGETPFVSYSEVKKDDVPGMYDRFIVVFNYIEGEEPDLSSEFVNAFLNNAANAVEAAMPGEINHTPT